MIHVQPQSTGVIVAFPLVASRPARPALRSDEPRGEILLFTGVRYERLPEARPEPPRPDRSSGRARRRPS